MPATALSQRPCSLVALPKILRLKRFIKCRKLSDATIASAFRSAASRAFVTVAAKDYTKAINGRGRRREHIG
jgi:hypothetical protein